MKIRPSKNLVILAPVAPRQPAGAIVRPLRYQPAQQWWRVLELGPKATSDLKPGEIVLTREIPNHRHKFADGVIVLEDKEILALVVNSE